jgi:glycosyltransferase involved in cell wall biosynthesis
MENQPINVLHVIHSLTYGGAENQVVTLTPALNNDRYNIHICCLQSEGVLANGLRAKGIQVISLNMRIRYWPLAVYKLYNLIKQVKPQIIHSHMYDASLWGTLVGKLAGVPVILTTEVGMTLKKHHFLLNRIINHYNDKMIAVSEEIRQYHIQNRVISPEKCITIPCAVDIERFNKLKYQKKQKTLIGGTSFSPLIGTVARLVPAKRLDYLLKAARIVCDTAPQVRFLIIGDGPLRKELEELALHLGLLSKNVKFLGHCQDITNIFSELDLFVLSSDTEGIPVSMLEAMAASISIVATNVGGIPQIIKDGHNGFLVSPRDPEGLANAILSLIDNSTLRGTFANEAYRTVKELYSTKVISQQIISLYNDLLEKKCVDLAL